MDNQINEMLLFNANVQQLWYISIDIYELSHFRINNAWKLILGIPISPWKNDKSNLMKFDHNLKKNCYY